MARCTTQLTNNIVWQLSKIHHEENTIAKTSCYSPNSIQSCQVIWNWLDSLAHITNYSNYSQSCLKLETCAHQEVAKYRSVQIEHRHRN